MKEIVKRQFVDLQKHYPDAKLLNVESDIFVVDIPALSLPAGFNCRYVRVMFIVPFSYPLASPHHFFVDEKLRRSDGGPLRFSAMQSTPYFVEGSTLPSRTLLMFFKPAAWSPNRDTLLSYVRIIKYRFTIERQE